MECEDTLSEWKIDNCMMEMKRLQIDVLKYLVQWITDVGRCEYEIKNRIEIARSTFIKMRDVLTHRNYFSLLVPTNLDITESMVEDQQH